MFRPNIEIHQLSTRVLKARLWVILLIEGLCGEEERDVRTKLWGTMRSTPRKSHQKSGFRSEKRRPSRREQSVMQQLFKEDNYN